MTAAQLIQEIECLSPAELVKVVRHTKKLDKRRQLSPEELGELALQMIDATDPAEADRLQEEIVRGF